MKDNQLILFCNPGHPCNAGLHHFWWMPLFIDRYFFFSSLSIPPLLAVLLTRAKKRFVASVFILFTLLFGYGLV